MFLQVKILGSIPAAAHVEPSKSLMLLLCDRCSRFAVPKRNVESELGRATTIRVLRPIALQVPCEIEKPRVARGPSFLEVVSHREVGLKLLSAAVKRFFQGSTQHDRNI